MFGCGVTVVRSKVGWLLDFIPKMIALRAGSGMREAPLPLCVYGFLLIIFSTSRNFPNPLSKLRQYHFGSVGSPPVGSFTPSHGVL
jgi:hypothetical protein